MSSSPRDPQDEGADKQSVDELDEPQTAGDPEAGSAPAAPAKRGRGRPKGSKNKKPGATPAATTTTESPPTTTGRKKRGRPPKERPNEGEPPVKRPRGRPPKPKPEPSTTEGATAGDASGSTSTKKKRGRPPKKTTA